MNRTFASVAKMFGFAVEQARCQGGHGFFPQGIEGSP
jgi:hypothetical protein